MSLSASDWTRIQRLRQVRAYATELSTNEDIAPPVPLISARRHVVGTSRIRRQASKWTDYLASQHFSYQSKTVGTNGAPVISLTTLCNCSTTTITSLYTGCFVCRKKL